MVCWLLGSLGEHQGFSTTAGINQHSSTGVRRVRMFNLGMEAQGLYAVVWCYRIMGIIEMYCFSKDRAGRGEICQ